MARKALESAVHRIRGLRAPAEDRLLAKRGVRGTMIGLKVVDGVATAKPVLTVFVSEKIPRSDLSRSDVIPKKMSVAGTQVETDVLEAPHFTDQADFPAAGALTTFDGTEYGTLTAFGRSQHGLFGITCAHAIEGTDNNPYTRSEIGIWSPPLNRAIPVGFSAFALAGGGSGLPSAYGFMDVATFSLENSEIYERASNGSVIPTRSPDLGLQVYGSANSGAKAGVVLGIEQRIGQVYVDVVVSVSAPGTFRGDSGMLWRDQQGRAIAVHAKGNSAGPGQGSSLSASMRADRAESGLGVRFVEV